MVFRLTSRVVEKYRAAPTSTKIRKHQMGGNKEVAVFLRVSKQIAITLLLRKGRSIVFRNGLKDNLRTLSTRINIIVNTTG
jgi:hypothetical protein